MINKDCGDSDHERSIKAIIAGLLKSSAPAFLIHLSGTGLLSDWAEPALHGKLNPKVWSDIDDIDEITSRPDKSLHRNVDKIVQAAAAEYGDHLKTAIVCPPDIYGSGLGPGRTQSAYLPIYFAQAKKMGRTFYAGEGNNTRSWVHIDDLMSLYLKLVEAAVDGGEQADWGKQVGLNACVPISSIADNVYQGYYFASSHEASQIEIAKAVGTLLHSQGLIHSAEPKSVPVAEIYGLVTSSRFPFLSKYLFASNSRTVAHRAVRLLGYAPKATSLWETLQSDLNAWEVQAKLV